MIPTNAPREIFVRGLSLYQHELMYNVDKILGSLLTLLFMYDNILISVVLCHYFVV